MQLISDHAVLAQFELKERLLNNAKEKVEEKVEEKAEKEHKSNITVKPMSVETFLNNARDIL